MSYLYNSTFNFPPSTPAKPALSLHQTMEFVAEDSWTVVVGGQIKTIPAGGQLTITVRKPRPTLGQIAYERHATAGRTRLTASSVVTPVFVDAIYPPWRRLNPEERKAWESTAAAVSDAIDEREELDD